MANRESIQRAGVHQFFTRQLPSVPEDALEMDVLLVAPHYHLQPATLSDGSMNPESRMGAGRLTYQGPSVAYSWGMSGRASTTYQSPVTNDLPGLPQAAVVDPSEIQLFVTESARRTYETKVLPSSQLSSGWFVDHVKEYSAEHVLDLAGPEFILDVDPGPAGPMLFGEVDSSVENRFREALRLSGRPDTSPSTPVVVELTHSTGVTNVLMTPMGSSFGMGSIMLIGTQLCTPGSVPGTWEVGAFQPEVDLTTVTRYRIFFDVPQAIYNEEDFAGRLYVGTGPDPATATAVILSTVGGLPVLSLRYRGHGKPFTVTVSTSYASGQSMAEVEVDPVARTLEILLPDPSYSPNLASGWADNLEWSLTGLGGVVEIDARDGVLHTDLRAGDGTSPAEGSTAVVEPYAYGLWSFVPNGYTEMEFDFVPGTPPTHTIEKGVLHLRGDTGDAKAFKDYIHDHGLGDEDHFKEFPGTSSASTPTHMVRVDEFWIDPTIHTPLNTSYDPSRRAPVEPVLYTRSAVQFARKKGTITTPLNLMSVTSMSFDPAIPGFGGLAINLCASFVTNYRALLRNFTTYAGVATTGNRPGFVRVLPGEVEAKLGPISTQNPLALAADTYFGSSKGRRVFCFAPDEVSALHPWGTPAALSRLLRFTKGKPPAHIVLLNDSDDTLRQAHEFCVSLGGTDTVSLKAAQRLLVPTKNPEKGWDTLLIQNDNFQVFDDGGEIFLGLLPQTSAEADAAKAYFGEDYYGDNPREVLIQVEGLEDFSDFDSIDPSLWEKVVDLSGGGKAFSCEAVIALDGSVICRVPFWVPTWPTTSVSAYIPGQPIQTEDGVDTEIAVSTLHEKHRRYTHPRLSKHHGDRVGLVINGRRQMVDGVYGLAQFAGLIAGFPQYKPLSQLSYPTLYTVMGTSDTFNDAELSQLSGIGLIVPEQDIPDESDVKVRRDVSSDTSTRVFMRRSAGVAEDMLARHIDRIIKPHLGPDLVTDAKCDLISGQLGGVYERHRMHFAELEIGKVRAINEDDRQRYGIDDTGVSVVVRYKHAEELSAAIVEHVVTNVD